MIIKVLNGFVTIALLWALVIFTSLFSYVPWHEGSGVQFVVVPVIIAPVLVLLSLAILTCKRFGIISIYGILNPAVTGLILYALIYMSRGPAPWMPILGTIVCSISITISISNIIRKQSNA